MPRSGAYSRSTIPVVKSQHQIRELLLEMGARDVTFQDYSFEFYIESESYYVELEEAYRGKQHEKGAWRRVYNSVKLKHESCSNGFEQPERAWRGYLVEDDRAEHFKEEWKHADDTLKQIGRLLAGLGEKLGE